jgi:hypothetical protein
MSSSGITPINSGPLTFRTYLDSSADNTYLLGQYDYPVSSNRLLITSTGGLLAPSDNVTVSSITVSTLNADNSIISTAYLSTVFSINSTVTFYNQLQVNNLNQTEAGPASLIVVGPTVLTEPGAKSTVSSVLSIYGAQAADPIDFTTSVTSTIIINQPINTVNFQIIGAGGSNANSNPALPLQDRPGYGGYIQGTLKVKQGDSLFFTVGNVGNSTTPSGGTSLIYISSNVSTLVAIAGAGGGNGYADITSSSSSGGHGGGGNGAVANGNSNGFINGVSNGTNGFDGLVIIDGNVISESDGGGGGSGVNGGQAGLPGGTAGTSATFIPPSFSLANGGLVSGGAPGTNTFKGGYGGGGFSGGGGGGASTLTSAGGGGGATFINFSQLTGVLSNVVSLGGEFLFQNNFTPFGSGQGAPNNAGAGSVFGYIPNETVYTNGDIQCRVLKYEQLDPPVTGSGGGSAALWALHPAIDTVHMNDNSIVECSSIQVVNAGIDITGDSIFRNKLSTLQSVTVASGGANITGDSIFNNKLSTLQSLTVASGGVNVTGNSIFNNNLNAGTVSTNTLNMTNGTITSVTTINSANILINSNVSTLGNTLISGTQTVNSDATVNGLFNTNRISMVDGQVSGVSSINSFSGSINITATNTSTIGNLGVSGNVACNTLQYNTLSPNVVTKLKTTGPNISISGGSGPDGSGFYTGNLSLDVTESPTISVVAYNPSEPDKTVYFGKYVVINTAVGSISLTGVTASDGNFITFINNTNGLIQLTANSLSVNIFQNTLQTAIYFSTWILPQYYSPPPLYILINDSDASTTLFYASLRDFSKLDYVIVGGGGGGGGGSTGSSYQGGGGGGSGLLKSSMTYIATTSVFSYNVTAITDAGATLTIPSTTTTISITIGPGGGAGGGGGDGGTGGTTSISFDSVTQVSVAGGSGGVNGNAGNRGDGGGGFNGGGGACGGRSASGGSGTTSIGGSNGQNAPSNDQPGTGGGTGGGWKPSAPNNFSGANENAGGGGGAGSAVALISGANTGGRGAGCYQSGTSNITSTGGLAFTGAGGGGGGNNVSGPGQEAASGGGSGYAILYFHN